MTDETQTEEKSGVGSVIATGAGAGVGAYAGAKLVNGHLVGKGVRNVLNNAQKKDGTPLATTKFEDFVDGAIVKDNLVAVDAATADKALHLDGKVSSYRQLKEIDPTKVTKINFSEVENGVHRASVHSVLTEAEQTRGFSFGVPIDGIKKLPEGAVAGEALHINATNAEKLTTGKKSFLQKAISSEESALVTGFRKVGGFKEGFKALGRGEQGIVIAGTVAAAAAGAAVLHATFGGKHANRVTEAEQTPTVREK